MKIHPDAFRFCFAIAPGLLAWQTGGCTDSSQRPFGPEAVLFDSCGPDSPATEPELLERVAPVYPRLAELAGLEGTVWVGVLIDTTGHVSDVRIVKDSGTNAGFEQASIDAAWQQEFIPAMKCGRPVAVWRTFQFEFRRRGGSTPADSTGRKSALSKLMRSNTTSYVQG